MMGLFNRGKKRAASGGSSAAPTAPAQPARTPDSLDLLMAEARKGDDDAMARLWEAIYRNPNWFFVRRTESREFSTGFNPFCGVVEDQPSVFAFSDSDRASRFAMRQKLGDSHGFGVLEMTRDAAIASVLRLASGGVRRIIFNDEPPSGLFAPLTNLVFMYSHILGVPLADAAAKFEQDVASLLHDRASQTGREEHIRELVAWAISQPEWWMLASGSGEPLVWKTVEGEATTAVFTSRERMEKGGQMMKLVPEFAPVPSLQLRVDEAIKRIEELVARHGLQTVALNLRVPIRADKLRGLSVSLRD